MKLTNTIKALLITLAIAVAMIFVTLYYICPLKYSKQAQNMTIVSNTVGQMPIDGNKYLPLIVNEGVSNINNEKVEVLIIGGQVPKGLRLGIYPIAWFNYQYHQKEKKYLVAIPIQQRYTTIKPKSLSELSTNYQNIRYVIEHWYLKKEGIECCEKVKWSAY